MAEVIASVAAITVMNFLILSLSPSINVLLCPSDFNTLSRNDKGGAAPCSPMFAASKNGIEPFVV